ncbi:MAG: FixH family protein [Candidatus Rokubacteria bacterium]|nr:FixH family protein [Candidatus Rokubacteria bacterium]
MRAAAWLLGLVLAAGCAPPAPSALTAEVRCDAERGLRHRCTVRLADGDLPFLGATVVLSADMPSMPLAHHVPPVTCMPGGSPGTYVGTLDFEMPGRWMLGIRITGPRPDYLTREVDVRG